MNTVEELKAQVERLREALNDLLNDCINFDEGPLTQSIQAHCVGVLKETPIQSLNEIKAQAIEKAIDSISENLSIYDICGDAIGEMHDYADKIRKE